MSAAKEKQEAIRNLHNWLTRLGLANHHQPYQHPVFVELTKASVPSKLVVEVSKLVSEALLKQKEQIEAALASAQATIKNL